MPPSARARTLDLERLRDESVTWRLIRADNAPLIVGILGTHLGSDQRRVPAADLFELVDTDLDDLRALGLALPKSAQGYCTDWRNAGFLTRRAAEETRGETYELSPGALAGIRMLDELAEPRQTATESRLASIAAQLGQLAIDTDPNELRRVEQLTAQRDRIDREIEGINAGEIEILGSRRAVERIRDILTQASEIPSDFARVRVEFDELNRVLRQRIVESDATQGLVLDEVFRGVDLIAESDEGRTFAAFSSLVLDPALGAAFDDAVDQVLARDFASDLSLEQRRFLRRFVTTLKSHSGEIQDVVTAFARGLRRYVQSQDYQKDRVMRALVREALALGVSAATQTKPYAATGVSFALSRVELRSAAQIVLYNPADFDASEPIVANESELADFEALRALARDTEIDFDELAKNVNAVLIDLPQATVGEVLQRFPASQGVASVIGLLTLAGSHGSPVDAAEMVRWTGADSVERHARVPGHRFTKELL